MANREQPDRLKDDFAPIVVINRINDLITIVDELKTDYNNLRTDFVRHDHTAAYTAAATRLAAADITPSSGSYASAAITDTTPRRFVPDRAESMSVDFRSVQVDNLLTLVSTLKTQVNNLRQDLRRHDHGATYTASTIRVNGSDNSLSAGSHASTTVDASVPKKFIEGR